ncbi:NEDD8 ultimate buster 1-like [Uranotaenia lowii]|uniref:NEDD8 ultimate buster 1-like n=1 Tax=Uranotaenia lowii TaxID=190385 RepID=UPI0024793890|nr:NEDD8 ultimate buster 1-like [Uranotaenia lowii]
MTTELEDENYVIQIRAKLNQQKVKLWELPFFNPTSGECVESELEKLANSFHDELKISFKDCLNVIRKLQQNALDKLKSKDEYLKTGIATLRIRTPTQGSSNRHFDVKVKSTGKGSDLAALVAEKLGLDDRMIKLVCAGKVVNPERILADQGVTNGATVMVLVLTQSQETAQQEHKTFDRVHRIRTDAELIINENDHSDFLSLEDQDGNAIHLPRAEKKALLMALTLYEKGKVALRRENFEEALLLFLEADSDFRMCNSQLLTVVDNYALLNLDIVWCYLCLKNINQLPDAEQRIKLCEEKFHQSYGENMRRVTAIKGTQQCNEKALLLRLHLLKAVLLFHQNKREDAETMFQIVETELQSLKIDDGCLTKLLEFGFELTEARIALRACSNNVEVAIEFINNRRETVSKNEKKSKRERNLYRKIGHNCDDCRINIELVDQLVEMGFPETLAAIALKRSANDLLTALNELQLKQSDLKRELVEKIEPCSELIDKLVDLGFHKEAAETALKQTTNNFEEAVEFLISAKNNNVYDALLCESNELDRPSTSSSTDNSSTDDGSTKNSSSKSSDEIGGSEEQAGPSRKRSKNATNNAKKEMMDILYKSFSKDMDTSSDTYLDLPLQEEATILAEYKKLLNMQ